MTEVKKFDGCSVELKARPGRDFGVKIYLDGDGRICGYHMRDSGEDDEAPSFMPNYSVDDFVEIVNQFTLEKHKWHVENFQKGLMSEDEVRRILGVDDPSKRLEGDANPFERRTLHVERTPFPNPLTGDAPLAPDLFPVMPITQANASRLVGDIGVQWMEEERRRRDQIMAMLSTPRYLMTPDVKGIPRGQIYRPEKHLVEISLRPDEAEKFKATLQPYSIRVSAEDITTLKGGFDDYDVEGESREAESDSSGDQGEEQAKGSGGVDD